MGFKIGDLVKCNIYDNAIEWTRDFSIDRSWREFEIVGENNGLYILSFGAHSDLEGWEVSKSDAEASNMDLKWIGTTCWGVQPNAMELQEVSKKDEQPPLTIKAVEGIQAKIAEEIQRTTLSNTSAYIGILSGGADPGAAGGVTWTIHNGILPVGQSTAGGITIMPQISPYINTATPYISFPNINTGTPNMFPIDNTVQSGKFILNPHVITPMPIIDIGEDNKVVEKLKETKNDEKLKNLEEELALKIDPDVKFSKEDLEKISQALTPQVITEKQKPTLAHKIASKATKTLKEDDRVGVIVRSDRYFPKTSKKDQSEIENQSEIIDLDINAITKCITDVCEKLADLNLDLPELMPAPSSKKLPTKRKPRRIEAKSATKRLPKSTQKPIHESTFCNSSARKTSCKWCAQ